jgi:hypothetical protein
MFARAITVADVRAIVVHHDVIAEYPDDKPYPSVLLLGYAAGRPLHVVVAHESDTGRCIVVTAYEPKRDQWETGFKVRRSK